MTPAARLSTSIEILDQILAGQPAGLTLTNWGRRNRFAGSRDRAAIRDIVFDCLRARRSLSHRGGAETGRAIVSAYVAREGLPLDEIFTGATYAPAPLSNDEIARLKRETPMSDPVRLNYPDFMDQELKRSLGDQFEAVMSEMLRRAPVDLRVNTMKADIKRAAAVLETEDILAAPLEPVPTALRVTENHRRVGQSKAYRDGLVELQDASSQAAALFANAKPGMKVLDYCAGGGGKSLALYAETHGKGGLIAHDIATVRMNDLPARASRAGARITIAGPGHAELKERGFDLVFVDAPCSGTGSWRRTPDAKWRLSEGVFEKLETLQAEILDKAATFVRDGGTLCYATCSMLACENSDQVDAFLKRTSGFDLEASRLFTPLDVGDGFYVARLTH